MVGLYVCVRAHVCVCVCVCVCVQVHIKLLFSSAFATGDPYRLVFSVDSQGRVCGRDPGVE